MSNIWAQSALNDDAKRVLQQRHMNLEERCSLRGDALHEAVIFHDEDTSTPQELKVHEVLETAEKFFDWICQPPPSI